MNSIFLIISLSIPDSSVGKESSCSAGDPSLIPGPGISAGEGIGYPLQYPWASVVTQLVMNPPAMQGTWVQSLGWEDPLEKGKATHSSILAWRIPWTVLSIGSQRVGHNWSNFTSLHYENIRIHKIEKAIWWIPIFPPPKFNVLLFFYILYVLFYHIQIFTKLFKCCRNHDILPGKSACNS